MISNYTSKLRRSTVGTIWPKRYHPSKCKPFRSSFTKCRVHIFAELLSICFSSYVCLSKFCSSESLEILNIIQYPSKSFRILKNFSEFFRIFSEFFSIFQNFSEFFRFFQNFFKFFFSIFFQNFFFKNFF